MKKTTLGDIANILGARVFPREAENVFVSGVATDTRLLMPGDIFVALIDKRDGHDFISDAMQSGAVAIIVSRDIESELPIIKVKDTLKSLGDISKSFRRALRIPVICVTGSVGKTSTRECIAFVLSGKFSVAKSEGNFNNLIGLPLSILRIEEFHSAAVLEIGINRPGEMDKLASIAQPDYAVVLNVAPVHLEGLESLEKIASEKLKILEYLSATGKAFICSDDELLMKQEIVPKNRVTTFGFSAGADFCVSNFSIAPDGTTSFEINGNKVKMTIPGRGAAFTAVCAFAVGSELGVDKEEIIEKLRLFRGMENRLRILKNSKITIVNDVYNSSPRAVESALESLANIDGSRKVAVFADMLELGENEIQFHEEMGTRVAENKIALLFLFGKLSKSAQGAAIAAGMPSSAVFWTDDFQQLKMEILSRLKSGDVVLVKGSHSMGMERLIPFLEGFR